MTYQLNEAQTKWLEALESGAYAQTGNRLKDSNGFCCLGVACEVLGVAATKSENVEEPWMYEGESLLCPLSIVEKLRLRSNNGDIADPPAGDPNGRTLAEMNDVGASFSEIAAFVRANPERVFRPC